MVFHLNMMRLRRLSIALLNCCRCRQPIPLNDSEAYAAAFAGIVHVPNAEHERRHVQDQLAVIYEHLQIVLPDNYLQSRSTTELKYELYYRLNYDVLQFISLDENESQIPDFLREYHWVARDTPQGVIDRLQGTFRQPDVLGFLFIMGFTMAFEPVDWALTTVDVINALSEGDIESAVGDFILGAIPFASSRMDDAFRVVDDLAAAQVGGRLDNTPKYFANPVGKGRPARLPSRHVLKGRGFTDEMIDMLEYRGATGPGTGLAKHNELLKMGPEHTSAVTTRSDNLGHRTQDANAQIRRNQYGYNIVNEPSAEMLDVVGFYERMEAYGNPIDSFGKNPHYIIEGRPFDAYTVRPPRDPNAPEKKLIETVWIALYEKVPSQTESAGN